ncbi:hypothetical protein C8Q74DRAFT_1275329 [Fomes fomentarius]|nr:hypothetical protein C8Q74DRAFT_1275329 [Fomes fomentarius]
MASFLTSSLTGLCPSRRRTPSSPPPSILGSSSRLALRPSHVLRTTTEIIFSGSETGQRLDTTGLEYNFTAASFLDLDRQVVDSEKQPQEPVSSLSKQDTSERKPDVWVGEDEWFAGGKVEVEVAPDFPRYLTLAEVHQEATTTNVQDEVKAEGETGVLMEVPRLVSLEVLNGSRAQLPLPTSLKRARWCSEDPKVTAAPRKRPRTQAYTSKIKLQQEWLAQGFAKVKTALNRLAPSRLPRPTRTLRA